MKREKLQELGLNDEQVNSVMAIHSAELNDVRAKQTAAEQERDSLKSQLDANQEDLKKFKESQKDSEELQSKLDDLQSKFDETKQNAANELNEVKKSSAIDMELMKAGARNPKAIKALLDSDAIKLDDDGIHGLKDQLDAVKESDGYLFESKEPDKPNPFPKGNPNGGAPVQQDEVAKALGLKTNK